MTNDAVGTASARQQRLRTPAHRVSSKAIWMWTAKALLGWIVAIGVQLAIWLGNDDTVTNYLFGITLVISAVLAIGHVLVMPQWRYRVHRWESTEDAVYTQTGWLTVEWRVAPVSRIQTVDTKRGPVEQLFKLATVTVTTASAAGPLEIAGMDAALAVRLVDELTAITQAVPGDAT
ncbi:MAG: PH domain-containing protein [Sciscionella sp.]